MHRRTMLTRRKYIYDIQACLLNEHYFLLKIVTSAGAYVKEFVHSDLGRTIPSVSSILGCQAEILQLDVIRLYDELQPSTGEGFKQEAVTFSTDGKQLQRMSWEGLKNQSIAHLAR